MTTEQIRNRYAPGHLAALRRFAIGITVLTVVGHAYLGFEQSYAQPLVALATAYSMQILLEAIDAWCSGRRPRFAGGFRNLVDFLLSAHITALAVVMMLYYNDRLWVVAFAAAVGIGSKSVFRAPVGAGTRHVFNPSNLGISVTLLLFPAVSLAFPWQFTAALSSVGDWALPAAIACIGTFLHGRFPGRLPVIAAFLVGFVLQMVVRWLALGTPLLPMIAPVTGVAAMIYTFFMLPDPATTPDRWKPQVAFGAAVAAVYFALVVLQIVFGLFFALTIVCGIRGMWLWTVALAGATETRQDASLVSFSAPRNSGGVPHA
jgi:enediyne biosynthesis protein E5